MRHLTLLTLLALAAPASAFQIPNCRSLAGLQLCGEWTDHADHSELTGAASVVTDVLMLPLANAELVVHTDPPAVSGSVDFALPSMGPLSAWGLAGGAPRASLTLGLGAGISGVEIGGTELPLHDEHPYLVYEIDGGLDLSFGAASIGASAGPTARVVIDPLDPLIYLEGDAVAALTGGLVSDGAVGVSLSGSLPYRSAERLRIGGRRRHRDVEGHLYAQGNCQLGSYPVYASSTVVLNADADEDGDWFFQQGESWSDFELGADGALAVGWDRGAISLTLPVASGSVLYRADDGLLTFRGHLESMNPFEGTALESLFPEATGGVVWGLYEGIDDFVIHAELESNVLGMPTSDLEITIEDQGMTLEAHLEPAYGDIFGDQSVHVTGSIDTQGQFVLHGQANLNLAGLRMADADVTWTNDGLRANGTIDIPGVGQAHVVGSIASNGSFAFTGAADFAPLGIRLAGATATVDNGGVIVRGHFDLPHVSSIEVEGEVQANGDYALSGCADITVKGFELAAAEVTVRPSGVELSGDIDVFLAEGHIAGRYETFGSKASRFGVSVADVMVWDSISRLLGVPSPYGTTGLFMSASMAIKVSVPGPDITLTQGRVYVTGGGVTAKGRVKFFGNGIDVKGKVASNGNFDLTGKVSYNISVAGTGVKGDLEVTVSEDKLSGKVSGKACVNLGFTKVCKSASASVNSSGKARLNMPSPVPDLTIDVDKIF